MKRIIMPDDWEGNPLLKTYPLQGDEFASWYEVDKIFGKDAREAIGPEIRDQAQVDRYDTKRSAKKLGYPIELVEVLRNQPQFYKLFIGEAMMSRRGIVHTTDLDIDSRKFISGTLSPTGLLPGAKAVRAYADARYLEEPYDDSDITSLPGSRRVSWVYAKDCEVVSEKGTDSHTVSFTLPPGSYATVLLEEIAGGDISGRNYRK